MQFNKKEPKRQNGMIWNVYQNDDDDDDNVMQDVSN